MIAILYPLKMDKNLSEAYSSIYEELHPTVARNDAINKANAMKNAQANKVPQNVRAASKRQYTAGGPKDTGANKYTTADKKTIINYNKDKMNNSYEPEGEMIDEKLSKEQQKKYDDHVKKMQDADKKKKKTGNPAFDDPSHHSFAKNKIKKNIFDEKEYNYVNSYLDELKKTTMGSYIKKASKDLADRRFDQGDSEKRKYDPDEADEKEDKKLDKREQGIARAAKKLTKEHHQKDADGNTVPHEDEAAGTPSSINEKTVLEQLSEDGREIDAFEAVISYLLDEKLAESWEQAEQIMTTLKAELVEEVYQNQLKKLSK